MLNSQSKQDRDTELHQIISPISEAIYTVDCQFSYIEQMLANFERDYGALDLIPDYQRGHVWTKEQQSHFIENILRRVVPESGFVIQFNCPNWNSLETQTDLPLGVQCVDGLQRLTAIRLFLRGDILPFGLSVTDLDGSAFASRRGIYRIRIAMHNFTKKADLLKHYLDLNSGGTPHSQEELRRVKSMLGEVILHEKSKQFFNKFEADRKAHFDSIEYPRYQCTKCVNAVTKTQHHEDLRLYSNHVCSICEAVKIKDFVYIDREKTKP
jgi:Protein of unknown function DUF262